MANRFLNNIKINDSYTLPPADGTADQIIKTNGTGQLSFVDQGDIVVGEADKAKSVTLRVKNSTASPMSKGQVVCEAVSASPPSGNLIEVALADNNGTNTMPALGILNEDLDAAGGANDEGDAIMFGKVSGINTSAFSVGDEVFVDSTPGGLTATKPTGVKYIQKVGVVIRDDASNGTIEVFGAGRVNDVPTPLYIDHANQRVGVRNEDPSYLLDINEDNNVVAFRVTGGGGGAAMATFVRDVGATGSQININAQSNFPQIQFVSTGNTFSIGGDSSGNFKISDNTSIGVSDRITIDNTGNVGIGETDPDAKLTVFRTSSDYATSLGHTESRAGLSVKSSITFDSKLTISSGASSRQYIQAMNNAATTGRDIAINPYGGNVGIGVTSPDTKLQVGNGAANDAARVYFSDNTYAEVRGYGMQFSRGASYLRPTTDKNKSLNIGNDGQTWNQVRVNTNEFTIEKDTSTFVKVNSSGNVGIGETDPSEKLHVGGRIYIESQGVDWNETTPGTSRGALHFDPVGDGANNTGNAITFGASDTSIGTNAQAGIYTRSDGAYGTKMYFATTNLYNVGSKTRMMIDSDGDVGIGTTNPGEKLEVAGDIKSTGSIYTGYDSGVTNSISCSNWFRTNGSTGIFFATYQGGLYMNDSTYVTVYNNKAFEVNNTGTSSIRAAGDIVAYYSDERLKTNLGNITNAVDKVKKLNGFYYKNNELANSFGYTENHLQVGVSAQEVEAIMPEVVKPAPFDLKNKENGESYSASGENYKTVKYEKLVPLLIEAIKEQQKQIDELKNQLDAFTK